MKIEESKLLCEYVQFQFSGSKTIPAVRGPVHGVNFSQVASKCSSTAHLNPANGLQISGSLHQIGVTGGFLGILKRFPQRPAKTREESKRDRIGSHVTQHTDFII